MKDLQDSLMVLCGVKGGNGGGGSGVLGIGQGEGERLFFFMWERMLEWEGKKMELKRLSLLWKYFFLEEDLMIEDATPSTGFPQYLIQFFSLVVLVLFCLLFFQSWHRCLYFSYHFVVASVLANLGTNSNWVFFAWNIFTFLHYLSFSQSLFSLLAYPEDNKVVWIRWPVLGPLDYLGQKSHVALLVPSFL